MGKLLFKMAAMLFVVTGISSYMLYLTTGQHPLSHWKQQLSGFDLQNVKNSVSNLGEKLPSLPVDGNNSLSSEQTVYKWVDENGVTQYSEEPPQEGVEKTELKLDINTNIVQGTPVQQNDETDEASEEVATANAPANLVPANTRQLIQDAQQVQELLKQRDQQMRETIDSQ